MNIPQIAFFGFDNILCCHYNVTGDFVFEQPKPFIENSYTYEENGVLYCASASEKGVYRYSYCLNNPLKYVDPTGQKLVIVGNQNNWTFKQLKSFTNLNLSLDKKTGEVTFNGSQDKRSMRRMSDEGRIMLGIINDQQITVKMTATDDQKVVRNDAGGAFAGNKFTSFDEYGNGLTMETDQRVNPLRNFILDSFGELGEGQTAFHEMYESYEGAKISMWECTEAGEAVKNGTNPIYKEAHRRTEEYQPYYNERDFNRKMRAFEEGMRFLKGMSDLKGMSVNGIFVNW